MIKIKLPFGQIRDSFKEIKMNQILDKISQDKVLTNNERIFLQNYEVEQETLDYKFLSKENIVEKIRIILPNKKIICNLEDSDGKIGLPIINISNQFHGECQLIFKNNTNYFLRDNFLYNLIYNNKKDAYSLEAGDEFYEEIESL